jgi:hypothetical protein
VKATKLEDLKKLKTSEKNDLVKDLIAGGEPTGDNREALKKVYESMDLDPKFVKKDDERVKKIGEALKGDKDLKKAKKDWGKLSVADKVKDLKKVVEAQSKAMGITPPEIVTFNEPPKNGLIENGHFDPDDGKLHLNINPASSVNDFEKALDLAAHENAHNYQEQLVKKLKDGKLKPGDDEYEQATMFAANDAAGAYIDPKDASELADYRKQPMEEHSWRTGPATAKAILKGL